MSVAPVDKQEGLAEEWQALEQRSDASVFLSWCWIETWLEQVAHSPEVVRVYDQNELIGLALLTRSSETRHGVLTVARIHFQLAGNPAGDQIWPEYNSLLMATGREQEVIEVVAKDLIARFSDWDEWLLGPIDADEASRFVKASELTSREIWRSPNYGVSLTRLQQASVPYLDSLSRNTRYQINRSFKRARARYGELRLEFAHSLQQAFAFYQSMAELHRRKWRQTENGSGFDNPVFDAFHRALIERALPGKALDLVMLCANQECLGYFYIFKHHDKAYFYLSGLPVQDDAKIKPGLMGHTLLIEHYKAQGFSYYDLMGGDDRYKKSLAPQTGSMALLALQRERAGLKLESVLRRFKGFVTSFKS